MSSNTLENLKNIGKIMNQINLPNSDELYYEGDNLKTVI